MAGFEDDVVYASNVNFNPGSPPNSGQVTTDGDLLIGSTASPNIKVGNITSTTLSVSYSSPNITIEAGTTLATTYTTDSGSATPASNVLNILGGPGVTTSGSGNTVTINSVTFTNEATTTTLTANSGSFLTGGSAQTYTLPAAPSEGDLVIVTRVTDFDHIIQASGLQIIRIGSTISSAGGTVTSSDRGDSLSLRFRDVSNGFWIATSVIGVWVLA